MNFSFDDFVNGRFDYDPVSETHTGVHIYEIGGDIGGGKITVDDIDRLKDYPDLDVIQISGLRQDTFEYFIKTYGGQFKAIRFFKNKFVEDWSMLGTLSDLKFVHFFFNQSITSLWDMSRNTSLEGLSIKDFSRLHSIEGIATAPALKDFRIGNAVWDKLILDSLMPLADTKIENLEFSGKDIADKNLSFLSSMPNLKNFDFAANLYTTEQVAWISSNFPKLKGYSIKPMLDCDLYDESYDEVPGVFIVGKRKPSLIIKGNEARIQKYVNTFERLKEEYRGKSYTECFSE